MLRSMQASQSNALVAALIIFAFLSYERGWLWRGGVAVGIGAIIKIFPLAALIFAVPRPDRVRAVLISILTIIVLLALPLLVVSPHGLIAQYQSWSALEKTETGQLGSSVMSLFHDAGLGWPAWPIQLVGCAILLGVLIARLRDWDDRTVRLQFLGFVMVFCVLFNHRAERQSAVIAICGMVIWYLASPRAAWRTSLFVIVYALVSLSGSGFIPGSIKRILVHQIRFPIPLTVLWLTMLGDLAIARTARRETAETNQLDSLTQKELAQLLRAENSQLVLSLPRVAVVLGEFRVGVTRVGHQLGCAGRQFGDQREQSRGEGASALQRQPEKMYRSVVFSSTT